MNNGFLKLILVAPPIGHLGSGRGGGVELTMCSLIKGLLGLGHQLTLIAPYESRLPEDCSAVEVVHVLGVDQPSWQHSDPHDPVVIPFNGVLPKLWEEALDIGEKADAVINFSYDWLPIWLTPRVRPSLFHLISMGGVTRVMKLIIEDLANWDQRRLAFHTQSQASDFMLPRSPEIVGNGFDLSKYDFKLDRNGPLGWAGRIAPEKGLEDAVAVAVALKEPLLVWGIIEDQNYAKHIFDSVPFGTIDWRGFLSTNDWQRQLGSCRLLLNTPKWNEAYGNVVVEALACGVPVVAYDRGGPGEIIKSGLSGWVVAPDDVNALIEASFRINEIDRRDCRRWVEHYASHEAFALRVEGWIKDGMLPKNIQK